MSCKLRADVLPSVRELALQFYTSECHSVSLPSPLGHLAICQISWSFSVEQGLLSR